MPFFSLELLFHSKENVKNSQAFFVVFLLKIIVCAKMFFTCFQADGCQLPNGVKIPNGWNHLYNNCQERCQCENNNFSCIPNTCDLSKNICIRDELGDSCQGAVFVVGLVQPVIIHFDGKIVRIRKITFFFSFKEK